MKKTLLMLIALTFLLTRVSADRHAPTPNIELVTSFNFSRYPACASTASSYCIHAVRFYDSDSRTRLAEVPVSPGAVGPQSIVATVHASSVLHHQVYAVAVYRDGTATPIEGLPGEVSSFHAPPTAPEERSSNATVRAS